MSAIYVPFVLLELILFCNINVHFCTSTSTIVALYVPGLTWAWWILAIGIDFIPLDSWLSVCWMIRAIQCKWPNLVANYILYYMTITLVFLSDLAIMSARSMYPHFIPLHENLLLQISWALRGLYDSFRFDVLFSTIVRCVLVEWQ